MVSFIEAHRWEYGVEPICMVLPIAPSTYYERRAGRRDPGRLCARARRDEGLRREIRRVWEENFGAPWLPTTYRRSRGSRAHL